MEPKRENNTNKMGLDVHRGAIKRRAISAINNSPLYFVGRGKHSAPGPSGLSHCNLALGVGILMPFPYSAPYPLIPQTPRTTLEPRGPLPGREYPRVWWPALRNSNTAHYLACHRYFTC